MLRVFGLQQLLRRTQFLDDRLGDVDPNARRSGLPEKTGLGPGLGLGVENSPDAPLARSGDPNIQVSGQSGTPAKRRRVARITA